MKAIETVGFLFSRLLAALALAAALAFPAAADDFTNNEALDALFDALRHAPDSSAAHVIDQQIWFYWVNPTDAALAVRMREAIDKRLTGDRAGTILILDKLVADYPGYAEAWNQRATMYYEIGNYEASIADCEKVLELEPRHFGALSGRAMMYMLMGERALALKDMTTAVAIHPFLSGQEFFPELQQQQETTHI